MDQLHDTLQSTEDVQLQSRIVYTTNATLSSIWDEMLPTPSTAHVDYDHIYEPAEDSYLVLDTLASTKESSFLRDRFATGSPSPLVLEVGTGSGVVIAFVTAHAEHIFGRSDVATCGADLNPFACAATRQTVAIAADEVRAAGKRPASYLGNLCGDLASAFKPGCVHVLIFNPPYVPSESLPSSDTVDYGDVSEETCERDMYLSRLRTDGGTDGMETTDRLLSQLSSVLSPRGIAYILLCAANKPETVMNHIRNLPPAAGQRWSAEKVSVSGKQAGWEKLCIIRIWSS